MQRKNKLKYGSLIVNYIKIFLWWLEQIKIDIMITQLLMCTKYLT